MAKAEPCPANRDTQNAASPVRAMRPCDQLFILNTAAMIFGTPPSFDDILESARQIEQDINTHS